MEGDPPKALGLALGGEHAPTHVKAFQGGVGFRVNPHPTLQHKGLPRRSQQPQPGPIQLIGPRGQRLTIKLQIEQLQINALQLHRPESRCGWIGAEGKPGLNQGVIREQLHR